MFFLYLLDLETEFCEAVATGSRRYRGVPLACFDCEMVDSGVALL